MRVFFLHTPLRPDSCEELRVGDRVFLSGTLFTARDAAHRRFVHELNNGVVPIPLSGSVIYYTGPCPGVPGTPILAAGPTTSGRMDPYTVPLLAAGVKATIGKGPRSHDVVKAMARHSAVYLVATGGAGALLAECIKDAHTVAYPELGPEAILELTVIDMPLIVAADLHGGNIYTRNHKS